jgi:hypothetical protein
MILFDFPGSDQSVDQRSSYVDDALASTVEAHPACKIADRLLACNPSTGKGREKLCPEKRLIVRPNGRAKQRQIVPFTRNDATSNCSANPLLCQ